MDSRSGPLPHEVPKSIHPSQFGVSRITYSPLGAAASDCGQPVHDRFPLEHLDDHLRSKMAALLSSDLSGNLQDWLRAAYSGEDSVKHWFPIPRVAASTTSTTSKSPRVRRRCNNRCALTTHINDMICLLNASFFGQNYERELGSQTKTASDSECLSMHAMLSSRWSPLLHDLLPRARQVRDGRRNLQGSTGVDAVAKMMKVSGDVYTSPIRTSSNYTPILGDRVDEPSLEETTVVDLSVALEEPYLSIYSDESKCISHPHIDPEELSELEAIHCNLGGSKKEYIRYHKRPEVMVMYEWHTAAEIKSKCGFKTIWKKPKPGKPQMQRKILPVCIFNRRAGDHPRNQGLSLFGSAALGTSSVPGSSLSGSSLDCRNCFTFVLLFRWMALHQACPPVLHKSIGSKVTKRPDVGPDELVFPCYLRLAMGSIFAVDIIASLERSAVGRSLIASWRLHQTWVWKSLNLPNALNSPICIELWGPDGAWSDAMHSLGWTCLHPLDVSIDMRLDLRSPLVVEGLLRLIGSRWLGSVCIWLRRSTLSPFEQPAVRSAEYPMGVPAHDGVVKRRLAEVKQSIAAAASLLGACCEANLLCVLMGAWHSWAWQHPGLIDVARKWFTVDLHFYHCAWNSTMLKHPPRNRSILRCSPRAAACLKGMDRPCPGCRSHSRWLRTQPRCASPAKQRAARSHVIPQAALDEWALRFTRAMIGARGPGGEGSWSLEANGAWSIDHRGVDADAELVDLNDPNTSPLSRIVSGGTIAKYTHVDDTILLSGSSGRGVRRLQVACTHHSSKMEGSGFSVSLEHSSVVGHRYIGYVPSNPASLLPESTTLGLLHIGIGSLLKRRCLQVPVVECVIGLSTWVMILNRGLMAQLSVSYTWAARFRDRGVGPMWPSLFRELQLIRIAVGLAWLPLYRPFLPFVTASDAEGETHGYGAVISRPPALSVVEVGLRVEARRTTRSYGAGALTTLTSQGVAGSYLSGPVHEMPASWLQLKWFGLTSGKLRRAAHINVGEGRVPLRVLNMVSRIKHIRHTRLLNIMDNFVWISVNKKGRSSSHVLNRVRKQQHALETVTGISVVTPFAPSRLQPADHLSRVLKFSKFKRVKV